MVKNRTLYSSKIGAIALMIFFTYFYIINGLCDYYGAPGFSIWQSILYFLSRVADALNIDFFLINIPNVADYQPYYDAPLPAETKLNYFHLLFDNFVPPVCYIYQSFLLFFPAFLTALAVAAKFAPANFRAEFKSDKNGSPETQNDKAKDLTFNRGWQKFVGGKKS